MRLERSFEEEVIKIRARGMSVGHVDWKEDIKSAGATKILRTRWGLSMTMRFTGRSYPSEECQRRAAWCDT